MTDHTKYIFNNNEYGKGRLVLAVVRQYLQDNESTLSDVQQAFPSSLQGSLDVVMSMDDLIIRQNNNRDTKKRYFEGDNETIETHDVDLVVVTREWGVDNIGRFIGKARELGYEITEVSEANDLDENELVIELSEAAIRNGYIKIPASQTLFESKYIADNEQDTQVESFILEIPGNEILNTHVLKNKGMLRKRFNAFFRSHNIQPDTAVKFTMIDNGKFKMSFNSEIKAIKELFDEYKSQPKNNWVDNYKERSQQLSSYKDKNLSEYDTGLLKDIWLSHNNGVFDVGSNCLSDVDFKNLLPELPLYTSKIINKPSPETWTEVNSWFRKLLDDKKISRKPYNVINRVFCTAEPKSYSTLLTLRKLNKLIKKLNYLYNLDVSEDDNWSVSNISLLNAIKSQGLQSEDDFYVNTFITELYKKLVENKNTETTKKPENLTNDGDNAMLCQNIIYYGPPGTGKTYKLQQLLKDNYTDNQILLDLSLWLNSKLDELGWLEIIILILLDSDVPMKVSAITSHEYYNVKAKINERDANLRATAWSALQSHAVLDSKTVNYSSRREPLVFDKSEDSSWYIVDDQLDQLDEYRKKLAEIKTGPIEKETIKRYDFVTFHQSYGYEEFIEGLRPSVTDDGDISYEIKQGVFKRVCKQAEADPDNQYAIVIDEINRGNISKIFGELITLVEVDKRAGKKNELTVTLPYSGLPFSVPSNLDIIGTMNTADRSLAHIDVALRRRFDFIELRTDYSLISDNVEGVNLKRMLYAMNQRIELLLDRDHILGHALIMNVTSIASLAHTFETNIMPLLEEYFFENWDKINQVLNKNGFIKELKGAHNTWLGSDDDYASKSYRINTGPLKEVDAYKEIYSNVPSSAFVECDKASEDI